MAHCSSGVSGYIHEDYLIATQTAGASSHVHERALRYETRIQNTTLFPALNVCWNQCMAFQGKFSCTCLAHELRRRVTIAAYIHGDRSLQHATASCEDGVAGSKHKPARAPCRQVQGSRHATWIASPCLHRELFVQSCSLPAIIPRRSLLPRRLRKGLACACGRIAWAEANPPRTCGKQELRHATGQQSGLQRRRLGTDACTRRVPACKAWRGQNILSCDLSATKLKAAQTLRAPSGHGRPHSTG